VGSLLYQKRQREGSRWCQVLESREEHPSQGEGALIRVRVLDGVMWQSVGPKGER
jgi:hypothetical protein